MLRLPQFTFFFFFLGHCYALQLGSHRVWDYKGDNFVHRLLQNKADGKLVPSGRSEGGEGESELGAANTVPQDKVDSVQLEYTYLLTSQLDSQRRYFEEKISRVEAIQLSEIQVLREKNQLLEDQCKIFKEKLHQITKEKTASEKKYVFVYH